MNALVSSCHFPDNDLPGPRFREAGELVLDQFHRDGRVDADWLCLHPREFALIWRLAAQPGERLTGQQLRTAALGIAYDLAADGITADIARMRGKLVAAGVGHLICTGGDGRYFIEVPPDQGLSRLAAG